MLGQGIHTNIDQYTVTSINTLEHAARALLYANSRLACKGTDSTEAHMEQCRKGEE